MLCFENEIAWVREPSGLYTFRTVRRPLLPFFFAANHGDPEGSAEIDQTEQLPGANVRLGAMAKFLVCNFILIA